MPSTTGASEAQVVGAQVVGAQVVEAAIGPVAVVVAPIAGAAARAVIGGTWPTRGPVAEAVGARRPLVRSGSVEAALTDSALGADGVEAGAVVIAVREISAVIVPGEPVVPAAPHGAGVEPLAIDRALVEGATTQRVAPARIAAAGRER